MDAFEDLVARLLRREGFWTRQSYRIDLTKAEKIAIGKPSMPRPEIDILAYKPVENRVAWVECKSYLDSTGVHMAAFNGTNPTFANRFKIFTDDNFRAVASDVLLRQVTETRLVRRNARLEFWLVAGNVAKGSAQPVRRHFEERKWVLRDRRWIHEELIKLINEGYEDDLVTMTAKLLSEP